MESIIKNIYDLLYLYDCVIVPGLGGFVGNYRSSYFREEHNLFIPPAKEIIFNKNLSYNDGLLANYISKKESVNYKEAVGQIQLFVKNFKSKLSQYGTVEIGDIGLFKKDSEGNLFFIPNEESSFLPDALGLTTFRFFPLEQKVIPKIEFLDDKIPAIKKYSVRNWAAVGLIALFSLFSTDLKMPTSISQAGIASNLFEVTSENMLVNDKNGKIDNVDEVCNNEEVTVLDSIVIKSKKYHLIAASFKYHSTAEKLVNEYKSEGYSDAIIIDGGNGRFRVSLLSFSDKNKAIATLEEFRKQTRFSTVWVLSE